MLSLVAQINRKINTGVDIKLHIMDDYGNTWIPRNSTSYNNGRNQKSKSEDTTKPLNLACVSIAKRKVCCGCKHEPYTPKYCDCCNNEYNNFEQQT